MSQILLHKVAKSLVLGIYLSYDSIYILNWVNKYHMAITVYVIVIFDPRIANTTNNSMYRKAVGNSYIDSYICMQKQ